MRIELTPRVIEVSARLNTGLKKIKSCPDSQGTHFGIEQLMTGK